MPVTGSTAPPEQRPKGRRSRLALLLVALTGALLPAISRESAGGSEEVRVSYTEASPVMYLSFDDGPHWLFTPMLLDLLDRFGARASFFPTGEAIAARWDPEITQALLSSGHTIGNHTWRHSDLSRLNGEQALAELARASSGLEKLMGYRPSCFRAPYGEVGTILGQLGPELGMTLAGWTADPQEWRDPPIEDVLAYLKKRERDGMVVLLHDRKWLTLHIAERVLANYSAQGWIFEALPGCRNEDSEFSRMAYLTPGDPPVGLIDKYEIVNQEASVEGWAFDADLPDGGLPIRVTVTGQEPSIVAKTSEEHRFHFQVPNVTVDKALHICVWAVRARRQGHDTSLGCRRTKGD